MCGMSSVLAYVAAAGIALWGVAHAVASGRVLAGFAAVTADSRPVVLQQWLAEAFTMRGLAAVVVAATAAGGVSGAGVRDWVYRAGAALLIALAVLTGLTGARTAVMVQDLPVPARGISRPAACR